MSSVRSLIGTTIADRYRLVELIGQGGMGAVFRAVSSDGADVALKVILPEAKAPSLLPRFLREARLAARIQHDNVVRVFDSGRFGDDRLACFLTMEFVAGLPLQRLLDAPLPRGAQVALMIQVLEAVAHMHARDVLHRDIKPDNVLVSRSRSTDALHVKVADFGIAAAMEADGTRLTDAGDTLGTPAYMAPEQALGDVLDGPGIDLYPVGVMLYRLLSGRLPFEGAATRVLYGKVAQDPPAVTDREGAPIEGPLGDAVMRLLARRPEARYSVAADVIADLRALAGPPRLDAVAWSIAGGSVEDEDLPPTRTPEPLPPAVVGRSLELGRLELVAEEVEAGVGRVVLVRGPVGIGKSALMEAFAVQLAESGRFQVLRVVQRPGSSAAEGLRGAMDRLLGTTGRGADDVRARAREFLRRGGETALADLDLLVEFLRPSTHPTAVGSALRDQNHALVVRTLRRMAEQRPVLLTFDNAAAGGGDAGAFLEYVLFELGYEPGSVLVIATAGPEDPGFDAALARTDRFESRTRLTMELGPLDPEALGRALAAVEGVGVDVALGAARRAGGNPLFAQHLVRAGAPPERTPTGSARGHSVPASLRAILERALQDRLEGAPHSARLGDLLVRAAVLGVVVPGDLLTAFAERDPSEVDEDLDALIDLGLLADAQERGEDAVVFAHPLLRDALLDGLSPRRARRLQLRAAELRRARIDGGGTFEAGAVGDHLYAAGRPLEAVDAWLDAVARAHAAGAPGGAVRWGMAALEVLPADDPRRDGLAIEVGRVLADTGDLDAARALLEEVLRGSHPDLAFVAGNVLGDLYENQGDGAAWAALMADLDAREPEAGDLGRRALGRARALWLNVRGRAAEGRVHAEEALRGAEPGEERQRSAQRLAFCRMLSGDPDGAVEAARTALAESTGRPDLRLRSQRTLVNMLMAAGAAPEATELAEAVLADARRMGARTRVPIALLDLGLARRQSGDAPGARKALAEAARVGRDLGFAGAAIQAQFHLLLQDLIEGDTDGVAEMMADLARRAGAAGFGLVTAAEKPVAAWSAAQRGHYDRARALLSDAGGLGRLPPMPPVAYTAEGIAEGFTRGVRAGRTDLRADAIRLWRLAADVWAICRHPERHRRAVEALTQLVDDAARR